MDNQNKSQIIVCKNCGKENNMNSELCSECGTLLKDGLLSCYKSMWKRAFDFKGRSSRNEFIKAYLANAFLFVILELLSLILGLYLSDDSILLILCAMIFFITQFAVAALTVRRLHDAGKSGWWELLSLIAIVGNIIIFIICCFLVAAITIMPFQGVYGPPPES